MKNTFYTRINNLFLLVFLAFSTLTYAQTEFTSTPKPVAQVQSSGGQISSGGQFSNFAVVGELIVTDGLKGGIYGNTAGYVFLENQGNTAPLDSMVLIHFMSATNGDKWSVKWNTKLPVREWYGVKMEGNKVIEINLTDNNLEGTLSSSLLRFDTAFIMSEVKILKLAGNKLKGTINPDFFGMKKLEILDLEANQFTTVPNAIQRLSNLTTLWLSNNPLRKLPDSIAYLPKLRNLFLRNTKLEDLPVPQNTGWKELEVLDLAENHFNQIPSFIPSLTTLRELHLANNNLKQLPTNLHELSLLEKLDLSDNSLAHLGTVVRMKNIRDLRVHSNKLGFEHLEPLVVNNYLFFSYAPQARRGEEADLFVPVNTNVGFEAKTSSNSTKYRWTKDSEIISNATKEVLRIPGFQQKDVGTYICASTNPLLPDLTILTYPVRARLDCSSQLQATLRTNGATEFCNVEDISSLLELSFNATNVKIEWYENNARLALQEGKTYRATQFGVYRALVTDANGCSAFSNPITIKQREASTISLKHDKENDLLIPVSNEQIKIFRWYLSNELIVNAVGQAQLKLSKEGRYRFEGYTAQGCLLISDNFDVSVITATQEAELESKIIQFYPNPTHDILNVVTNRYFAQSELKIQVIDMLGRISEQVESRRIDPFHYQVNMSNLAAGNYLVRLSDGRGYELIHKILKK